MEFICDQNFEQMTPTEKGHFCNACQKDVVDLRSKSYTEIQLLKNADNKLCGAFLPEQVEDIYPINIPYKKPFYFATFLTIFGININKVEAQEKQNAKTEQTSASVTPEEFKAEILSYYKDTTITEKYELSPREKQIEGKKPFIVGRNNNYYWIKKFPFITRRTNRRIVGRF